MQLLTPKIAADSCAVEHGGVFYNDTSYDDDDDSSITSGDCIDRFESLDVNCCSDDDDSEGVRKVSPATTASESTEKEVTVASVDGLVDAGQEGRLKLKELYEKLYGEPHPMPKVRSKTLGKLIKQKL